MIPPPPLRRISIAFALSLLTLDLALADPNPTAITDSDRLSHALAALDAPGIHKRQRAIATLAQIPGEKAEQALLAQFDRWQAGALPIALWLDLAEAAGKRDSAALKTRLADYERATAAAGDPLHRWRECLEGGDADEGREIFFHQIEATCVRCHKIEGEGAEIGPDLTGLGQRMDRLYILESIVDPNAIISPGFDQVLLRLASGEEVSGIVQLDAPDSLTLVSVTNGKKRQIKTAEIAQRTPLPSAMPPAFGQLLSKRNIRDLVEFIATSQ